jgi:AGZA family xanthine/uracil permease-like MFS transporter
VPENATLPPRHRIDPPTGTYPWFTRADVDGFFALFQNNLANFALIAILMAGIGFPADIIAGRMIPGAAVAVLFGNLYYARMARRLAEREGRHDVTALAYGISTPIQFVYTFGILAPALALTKDPELAWRIGVGAVLAGGVVECLGAAIGPWVRRQLPRAAMLGALAGIALTFIGGELYFKTYSMPIVGSVTLGIILAGFVAKIALPGRVPASLVAIVAGTVIAYALGRAEVSAIVRGAATIGWYPPVPTLAGFEGLRALAGPHAALVAVIVPIAIYNFLETLNNVEAVSALGDDYDVRRAQLADGAGTIIGGLFGGVLPTTVYIASVGIKEMGAGRGYSVANGVVYLVGATFGLVSAIAAIVPLAVIAPILVFVGIVMVASAFTTVPARHAPAVALAMLPPLANFLQTRFGQAAPEALVNISPAVAPLAQGALLTAMLWGAVAVFVIDRLWTRAAAAAASLALCAAVGLVHAPRLAWLPEQGREFVYGYVILALMLGALGVVAPGPDRERTVRELPVDDRP